MLASQQWMDTVANNLANASTTGFKRDGLAFSETFNREMRADGGHGKRLGTLSAGAGAAAEYTVFEPGALQVTGNPLDVAIDSPHGLFAVQTPNGTRYTRDGSFSLNNERQLVNKNGHPVLDDAGNPIDLPQGQILIDSDGQISSNGQKIAKLGIFDGTFHKEGENLFTSDDAAAVDTAALKPGSLEGSNVNAVQSMIEMITIGRHYELAQRSITQQDELIQKLIQSLQDR